MTPSLIMQPARLKAGTIYGYSNGQLVPIGVTRGTTAFRTRADGLLESVAANVPRLDYRYAGALQSCPMWLVEPAATNLLLRSEEFDNASWGKLLFGSAIAPVVTANAGTSPNNTLTADRIVFNPVGVLSTDASLVSQTIAGLTSGTTYTFSIYLKSNTGTNHTVIIYDGNAGPATRTTAIVTNKWQRFVFTRTISLTSFVIRFGSIGNVNPGIQDILAWGAQIETGSVATSYIPTTSSTATRNADVIQLTGATSYIGQTAGAVAGKFVVGASGTTRSIAVLSDGTTNNMLHVYLTTGNALVAEVYEGGILSQFVQSGTLTTGVKSYCVTYSDAGSITLYVQGELQEVGSPVNIPALSQFRYGSQIGGINYFNGHLGAHVLANSAITQSEAINLSLIP